VRRSVVVVVMGAAGSGKTTVGRLLADALGVTFADADEFHPAANVAKMATGRPLDDADRAPWLAALADWLRAHREAGEGAVLACSALKAAYRDRLRQVHPELWLLYLEAGEDLLTRRIAARRDHFMPASMVGSQLRTLEPPRPGERGLTVDAATAPTEIVRLAAARLGTDRSPG
jgi:gluconokinase